MFNGGLSSATVQPPAQPQRPYGFEQALEDVLGILGFADEEEPQLDAEGFVPPEPMSEPYQPRESANVLDRQGEAPRQPAMDAYKRFADDPKRAAARISLLPRGVVPFATAAYDYATGNNPNNLSLSGMYRQRQLEADMITGEESPTADWVRAYAPMAIGAGLGALKPARTVMGSAMRGGAAGAAYGGLEGYFAKGVEGEDLDSAKRIGRGLTEAGVGFVSAAPAGAAGHAVRGALTDRAITRATRSNPPQERKEPRLDSPAPKDVQLEPSPGAKRESRFEKRYVEDLSKAVLSRIESGMEIRDIAKKFDMDAKEIARALEVSRSIPNSPRYARARAEMNDILGAAPKPAAKPASQAQPAPTAQQEAPKPKSPAPTGAEIEAKTKAAAKSKSPISQREFRRWNNTEAGKESWREVKAGTRKAQLDADAEAVKSLANPRPMREVLAQSGYPNARRPEGAGGPNRPNPPTNPRSGAPRGERFAPEKKRGVMEIADDISAKSGRSPSKWARGDKEEFVRRAATQTNMRPSQVYNLLKSYGEEGLKAKRGISTKRIREIMDEVRASKKKD